MFFADLECIYQDQDSLVTPLPVGIGFFLGYIIANHLSVHLHPISFNAPNLPSTMEASLVGLPNWKLFSAAEAVEDR